MNAPAELVNQHLIDPEICIRCNTCEETCPIDAITHDARNYVVKFDVCESCRQCIPPCPTGAIDSWRRVAQDRPYTVEEQFSWDALPEQAEIDRGGDEGTPEDVVRITAEATAGQGGRVAPPWSAAHPYQNLYGLARPAVATCSGNFRLTGEDASSAIHHVVLDFGKTAFPVLEGQSIGVIPPGTDAQGKPHSSASTRSRARATASGPATTTSRSR